MGLDYQGDRNSRGKKTEIGREIFSFMSISWEITSNLTITSINASCTRLVDSTSALHAVIYAPAAPHSMHIQL